MRKTKCSPQWIIKHLPPPRTVRRYINPKIGREGFFNTLNAREVRYVILRWFEDLSNWAPNEDIDLLIHDEDMGKMSDLFVRFPQNLPCDVYSISAVSGWNGMPYYPPHIAKLILQERVLWHNKYYIPRPEHHFLSLAYHVVYHKAESSGFPLSKNTIDTFDGRERRYTDTLTRLGEQVGIQFEPNLQDLHILLRNEGWAPPIGTLRKLAQRSNWLTNLLPPATNDVRDGELMVFIIREWAVTNNCMDFILDWFEKKRDVFDVLKVKKLSKTEQLLASEKIRGGVWGRGPYPVSGGKPSAIIVVYDFNPAPISQEKIIAFPFINNEHFFLKCELRDEINKHLLRTKWVNCVHSSDDETEAWEYLKAISCLELIQQVLEKIEKQRKIRLKNTNRVQLAGKHKQLMSLIQFARYYYRLIKPRHTRRAILKHMPGVVQVGSRAVCRRINMNGKSYIRKSFKSGKEGMKCYRRELLARELFEDQPWVAPIIKKGNRWLLLPCYPEEARLDNAVRNMIPETRLKVAKQAIWILFEIFMKGYAHRDFHAKNLFWVNEQLILIDFEEIEPYPEGKRPAFPKSFDIIGEGLHDSGFGGCIMCYTAETTSGMGLQTALGVPLQKVLAEIEEEFKEFLRGISKRPACKAENRDRRVNQISSSLNLPYLTVDKTKAQYDYPSMSCLWGFHENFLQDKTLLHLGSNTGEIIFEAQKLRPSRCVGIEYDSNKADLASKIAAYYGLNNVQFIQADIDKLDMQKIGSKFDIVFCFDLEAHIKKNRQLFRLLGEVTKNMLYFQSNGTVDVKMIKAMLLENGFSSIEQLNLPTCNSEPVLTSRPVFLAKK